MTANPRRDQNPSSSFASGAAPTINAQNFQPNDQCRRRYRHQRKTQWDLEEERSAASGNSMRMCFRSTSRILGTATTTDTRRLRIWRVISCGLYPCMKTVVAGIKGKMNIVSTCPNKWLIGIKLRKRNGSSGRNHLRYAETMRAGDAILARMLPCVIRTPLGLPVAPDVNTISTTSSLSIWAMGTSHSREGHSRSQSLQTVGC